jgi:16S rRNA (adenine(1408)-N(1))-methyltransferase
MEIMQGKHTREMNADEFALIKSAYQQVLMDIGTGDGRFVLQTARTRSILAIGIDACRENLRAACRGNASVLHMERKSEGQAVASLIPATGSSARPGSVLFVIAEASRLPAELNRLASLVTVNFPWGSLRDGLLNGDAALLEGIRSVMQPGARLEIRLNASALAEAGWDLLPGSERVRGWLAQAGFDPRPVRLLDAAALRAFPSTWAKRLAYSRRPEAVFLGSLLLSKHLLK